MDDRGRLFQLIQEAWEALGEGYVELLAEEMAKEEPDRVILEFAHLVQRLVGHCETALMRLEPLLPSKEEENGEAEEMGSVEESADGEGEEDSS